MCASRIATPEKSSAEDEGELPPAAPGATAVRPGRAATAALLALNTLPLLLATGVVVVLVVPPWSVSARSAAAAALLWLVPPLLCRLVFALAPVPDGHHVFGSAAFWSWWISLKLQTLFLRLPLLEELLRLVPGLYSAWLRLWGARIGRLTYWAPGLEITDRPLLDVGDNVVFGGKARLGAHVLRRAAPDAPLELIAGRIRIGHRCSIGAQSTLGPGVRLDDDEFTRAFFLAPPFSHWRAGRRLRPAPATPNPPSPP
jgi:hypothetical protein